MNTGRIKIHLRMPVENMGMSVPRRSSRIIE